MTRTWALIIWGILAAGASSYPKIAVADDMAWTLRSKYEYRVQVEFYSQDRNHVWPGFGKAYELNDYRTY
jgi:hypothetical protein